MSLSVKPESTTLPASLQYIADQLRDHQPGNSAEVRKIVLAAEVSAKDLAPWADFDHPIADSYGRKMVFKDERFEIMVMSWRPGDFSAIHDHGHAQWGAVQIFGPAEHATFRLIDDQLHTLARWRVQPGDVIGVNHQLIHQMGNPTADTFFLSLHVYGEEKPRESITGEARLFELHESEIQRVDGGVFLALPEREILKREPGIRGDFPTRLRHMIELIRRVKRMEEAGLKVNGPASEELIRDAFHPRHREQLRRELAEALDEKGHVADNIYWRSLNHELRVAAQWQKEWRREDHGRDAFHRYATRYDDLIGKPCLDGFMRKYLYFAEEKHGIDFSQAKIISLGCGTGLVEEFMQKELGVPYPHLYGIDLSPAMVREARHRLQADVGDILHLDPSVRRWDLAYSGLNVFHYLPSELLREAIQKTAAIVRPGGYFIGDFITPDHIRWYPNVMHSDDQRIISLRSPELIEDNGLVYQESDIINLDYSQGELYLDHAGRHRRFLPPLHRVRQYFREAFGEDVYCYDAVSLAPIPDWADSCPSTRYLLVAKKG